MMSCRMCASICVVTMLLSAMLSESYGIQTRQLRSSLDDIDPQTQLTITIDYLIAKWKLWYNSLDVNHDGKISIEDMEESRNKFADMHGLDAKKAQMVKDKFARWWNEFIFRGREGDISEQEFVDALAKDSASDNRKFKAHMNKCFDLLFDVIDTNKDRSISEDEFLIAFKAYGHENVALDTSFFKGYNPTDGLVPLRQIVDSWIHFVVSDKPGSGDIVKQAFESGV